MILVGVNQYVVSLAICKNKANVVIFIFLRDFLKKRKKKKPMANPAQIYPMNVMRRLVYRVEFYLEEQYAGKFFN